MEDQARNVRDRMGALCSVEMSIGVSGTFQKMNVKVETVDM
jgi:hypothetical protein